MKLKMQIKDTIIDKLYEKCNIRSFKDFKDIIEDALIKYTEMQVFEINKKDIKYKAKYFHYVYIWLNPLKEGKYFYEKLKFEYEPFYVGMGYNNRDISLKDNDGFLVILEMIKRQKLEPIVIRFQENLHPFEAYKLETYLIKSIGQLKNNNGPLTNMTTHKEIEEVYENFVLKDEFNIITKEKFNLMDNKIELLIKSLNSTKNIKQASKLLEISERSCHRYIKGANIIYDYHTRLYKQN